MCPFFFFFTHSNTVDGTVARPIGLVLFISLRITHRVFWPSLGSPGNQGSSPENGIPQPMVVHQRLILPSIPLRQVVIAMQRLGTPQRKAAMLEQGRLDVTSAEEFQLNTYSHYH
ncbi:hypothetical protein B566_EDAN009304 [Ephemera danica]|nr:hypothetical protein B566_EDAN009304 [Ephemera danica]